MTYEKEAREYLDKEIQKCINKLNGSDNPNTRYKYMERQSMFEELLHALSCFKELEDYRALDMRCRSKYGVNISRQLGV